MTINDRTRLLSLVFSTVTAGAMVTACSGIDGLPDEPNDRVDAGQDAAPSVDATLSDAGVAEVDAQVSDAQSTQDATVDAGLAADSAVDDAAADASVDAGPCQAEDNGAFCTRQGKNCGTFSGFDNCGTLKTVASCGVCSSYYESCGGGNLPNVCGCAPESDWAFCTRTGHSCGSASGTDNCGNARTATSCGGACPADAGAGDAGAVDASTVQRWTFTNCTATGAMGPTQAQCDGAYLGTILAGSVSVNAGIQSWTVPATGTYRIVAMGAQGGGGGGKGALIQGDFEFNPGSRLRIIVGHRGSELVSVASQLATVSGGGGSYMFDNTDAMLIASGGGGGDIKCDSVTVCECYMHGVGNSPTAVRGCGRVTQVSTSSGSFITFICSYGDPSDPSPISVGCVSRDAGSERCFANDVEGSFGGGRVGLSCQGGGGGGFAVGGRGNSAPGGGGSSFSAGNNPVNFSGYRTGDGLVTIERIR